MSGPVRRERKRNRTAAAPYKKRLPLVFWYKSETTGLSTLEDHIIAIGVTVDKTLVNPPNSIKKLVGTSREIHPTASQVNGITSESLDGKDIFPKVLNSICVWIEIKCKEAEAKTGTSYYPVVAAHNGLKFHFEILVSEIKRHGMDKYRFEDIMFTDTLQVLKMVQRKEKILHDLPGLELEFLYRCFGTEFRGNKEKDVLVGAMKLQHTFTNTQLQDIFRRHMRYHCYTYDCLETRYVDAVKKKGHIRTDVFILYCKDAELQRSQGISLSEEDEFCQDILELANVLMWCGGINCSLDVFEQEHKGNWNQWTLKKIEKATFVIMVCSPQLMKYFSCDGENDVHMYKGMFFSSSVVNLIKAPKFIPVFLNDYRPSDLKLWVPAQLHTSRLYCLHNLRELHEQVDPEGSTSEERAARLTRSLTDPQNKELAELVRRLRKERDAIPPEAPARPIPLPMLLHKENSQDSLNTRMKNLAMNNENSSGEL